MARTTADRRTRQAPVATGVAGGSLGTGTAVDDETTLMAVPDAPAAAAQPEPAPSKAVVPPQAAAPVAAGAPPPDTPQSGARRDPYRPIGIALAAILVVLAGFAVLSSGGDSPIDAGPPPAAGQTVAPGPTGDADEGSGADEDDGDGRSQQGNCNGRGNDPCDREGGGGD